MGTKQKPRRLRRKNTRKHWALYGLDAYEEEYGHEEGATADHLWSFLGGEESIVFTSRSDAGAALRAAWEGGFLQRRTLEGEWNGPKLVAYRLNSRGLEALQDAGKPDLLPNRKKDNYTRSLPTQPDHEVRETL